jgi:hypothetical protein
MRSTYNGHDHNPYTMRCRVCGDQGDPCGSYEGDCPGMCIMPQDRPSVATPTTTPLLLDHIARLEAVAEAAQRYSDACHDGEPTGHVIALRGKMNEVLAALKESTDD